MAQKWQTISELAADTSRKVTHSPEEWCRFLTTAARFYKAYDFDDQLLIYAQKPDATACADMSTWNNKMRRWVNAGSTAIALIRKGYGGKPYLDYVHDVADTHPVRGGKDPWLWKLTEENREPVMERLRSAFAVGRRLNVFFFLDDLQKPELHRQAEAYMDKIKKENPNVDFALLCNYVRQSQI